MKKHTIILFIIKLISHFSFGQTFQQVALTQQPSNEIYISLSYRKVVNPMAIGQGFTYFVENLTDDNIDVYFDIVAKTVCGNEVSDKAVNSLKPREKSGGGNEVGGDAMISYVKKQDCEGNKISYIDNGNTITGTNRINDVYIKNLVVKHRPKKLVESKRPNEKTKKQLADEEKLNQAMMKQLEKDFDIAHNAKKEEPVEEPEVYESSFPKTKNENSNLNNLSANTIKLTTPYFERLGKQIVFYRDSVLKRQESKYSKYVEYGKLAEDFDFYFGSIKITAKKNTNIEFFYGYLDKSMNYDKSNIGNVIHFRNKNTFKCTECRCKTNYFGEPSESEFIFKADYSFIVEFYYECKIPRLTQGNIGNTFNKKWPN